MKRVAARKVYRDGIGYNNQVIELDEQQNHVLRMYPLTEELPMTIWTNDTLEIINDRLVTEL